MSGNVDPTIPNPAETASPAGAPAASAAPIGVGDAIAAPAPAAGDAVAAPAANTPPALEPSLLEGITAEAPKPDAGAEPTTDEKKPDSEAKPDAAAAPAEGEAPKVELPPVDYKFGTPKGVSISTEQGNELKAALDAFRADPAKGTQGLIDLHAKAIQQYADQTLVRQYETFNQTRKDWQGQVLADEQLGGSGHKTTMRAIARMRDRFVPEARREAFNQFMRVTGAGDHPEFLRLLHNVAGAFDEPTLPSPNPKPPPDLGRKPGASKTAILYGK